MLCCIKDYVCPDNKAPQVREDMVQHAVDQIFKHWKNRSEEKSICETCDLSKKEELYVFTILIEHGWAVYTKPDYHPNEAVYVNVRMPTYGTQVQKLQ